MAERYRRPGASFALVAPADAPAELTKEEAEAWNPIIAAEPADWFSASTRPLLAQYCRHSAGARRTAKLLEALQASIADMASEAAANGASPMAVMISAAEPFDRLQRMQARAGGVPNDRNLISFYADGGLLYKGLVPGRPDDKVGVAAAHARVGNNARGLDADIGLFGHFFCPVRTGETMIEMMYQAQLVPWWMLPPDLQYIIRPGGGVLNPGGSLRPNAWAIGLRSSLNF